MKLNWEFYRFDELTTRQLYLILQKRVEVFVVEQTCPYPEVDGKDHEAYHLVGWENENIGAYARLFPAGVNYAESSIGRVLVSVPFRKKGLGRELMTTAIEFLENNLGEKSIKIQAQNYLRSFYESLGFHAVSDVYPEDGIPHVDMVR